MSKYHPKNERIKRDYFRYLAEADGKSASTIEGIRKSLLRFEEYNRFRDFVPFHREQAIAFKKKLSETKAQQSERPLSKSTILSTLNHLKSFFKWLSLQPYYKSKIQVSDIEYFNLTDKEIRAARGARLKSFPTLEQIHRVIFSMPHTGEIQLRNRALIALTILTGIRIQALVSLKLKHVDVDRELVIQDPREVKTKFSKVINTYFFPIGDDIKKICIDWVSFLKKEKLFGYEAPLFPRTRMEHDENLSFKVGGLEPQHWSTTQPARHVFKEAFQAAGLPYYNPHSFRDTLAHLMTKRCQNMEEVRAWSLNLGHESPVTTFTSYGHMDPYRQGEVIKGLVQF